MKGGGPVFKSGHLMWLALGIGVAILLIRTTKVLDGLAGLEK
jgi:hypothetical protein